MTEDRKVFSRQYSDNPIRSSVYCLLIRFPVSSVLCLLSEASHAIAKRLSDGASTACTSTVSGSVSLPSPGFFSPFPHGTGSLSVGQEYLALEDGPPMFRQGFSCPALLTFMIGALSRTGLSPSLAGLSRPFR